jgi:hypothetical protein
MNYKQLVIGFGIGMVLGALLTLSLSHRYIIVIETGGSSPVLRMDRLTGKTWLCEMAPDSHYRWKEFAPDAQ